MIRCLKIELCTKNLFQDDVLATEYIYLDDISHPRITNGSYPFYGPVWIDLFDEPYILTLKKQSKPADYIKNHRDPSDKNIASNLVENENEIVVVNNNNDDSTCSLVSFNGYGGNRFVARMLLNIESTKYYKKRSGTVTKLKNVAEKLNSSRLYSKTDFVLFACLTEVSMINNRFSKGLLSFRLTIGNFGYSNENARENENYTVKTRPIQLSNDMPVYLAFEKTKPCLSVEFKLEDTSHVLYKINYIKRKTDQLVRIYEYTNFIFFLLL